MKFGAHLAANKESPWADYYVDYKQLKIVIAAIAAGQGGEVDQLGEGQPKGITSLSVPRPNAADRDEAEDGDVQVKEEDFFVLLEQEIKKVQDFTHLQVTELRAELAKLKRDAITVTGLGPDKVESLRERVNVVGSTFLQLEKYVNINFTAFYKILKKHDKNLPNAPACKTFYMSRLHHQSWVRGDYSDVLVTLSDLYAQLRGDQEGEADSSAKGSFVRSTSKYWVRVEDVSEVKYTILQHLPVFLQKEMGGESDSQLINSVYLDNPQLELYHGRLDKTPGAIALRVRWYGAGGPKVCFVERKTHEDKWTGEQSVKERFIVSEEEVNKLLKGTYDMDKAEQKLRDKGQSEEDILDWRQLVVETLQAITSKQLVPTMRSQYMRTAFQIPFDATVRVSLDTNLCMINDRDPGSDRWYRDPSVPVPNTAITRFPHAILEVKLQLQDESEQPDWIRDLCESGMLHEVHKFSKFMHGCATLLSEDVQAVPYWIDDASIKQSIVRSGAADLLTHREGANAVYNHLLPFTKPAEGDTRQLAIAAENQARAASHYQKVHGEKEGKEGKGGVAEEQKESKKNGGGVSAATNGAITTQAPAVAAAGAAAAQESSNQSSKQYQYTFNPDFGGRGGRGEGGVDEDEDGSGWQCCQLCGVFDPGCLGAFGSGGDLRMRGQKVEPKLFFANERTFIHWLHMAVTLSSVSVGVLAFTKDEAIAQYYALAVLPVSLMFVLYALYTFLWRAERISSRVPARWDDSLGPLILALSLSLALAISTGLKIMYSK